ncbi:ABC transporter permease [Lacticigenium naphthae]|uniref:ABC transporter permease n=1 Tax=Lacticigenium naphthae TaxID=515351 RepID=UPI0004137B86|nr:hypothetical protein [Lacticigenium naphthae]
MGKLFSKQTSILTRFIFKREWVKMIIWIGSIVGVTVAVAAAFTGLYSSEAERQGIAQTMDNPAMTAMLGPSVAIEDYTFGAMFSHEMLLFTAITVAIMNILMINRLTRLEEEENRLEIIQSLPVERNTYLFTSLLLAFGLNSALALLTSGSIGILNIESMDWNGSLLYGVTLGATGFLFACLTAVFAQISPSSRGTLGLSFFTLGFFYLLRAIGDVTAEWLSLLSPLGWVTRTETYVENKWLPILLIAIISLLFLFISFWLHAKRDMQDGFLPERKGRIEASSLLHHPLVFIFRLQRVTIFSWLIGLFILGVTYGSVLGELETFFESNDLLKELLTPDPEFSLVEQFLGILMSVIAIIGSIPPIMIMNRLYKEEKIGRNEWILTHNINRTKLFLSYLSLAIIVAVLSIFFSIIGLWIASVGLSTDPLGLDTLILSGFVYLPAMTVMLGLATLIIAFKPNILNSIWMYLSFSFIVVYLGSLLQFDDWLLALSPYGNIPKVPVEEISYSYLAILVGLSLLLYVVSLLQYQRRDLKG